MKLKRQFMMIGVLLTPIGTASAQSYGLEVIDVSGGVAVRNEIFQCQSYRVRPTSNVTVGIRVFETATNTGVESVQVVRTGFSSYPGDGGHVDHSGGYGSMSPSSVVTNDQGIGYFSWSVGRGSQTVYPTFRFDWDGETWSDTSCNAFRIAEEDSDYPWIGTGNFILIGETSSHPSNHYGQAGFLDGLRELALAYGNEWNLNLAYNDASLIWGGVFDLNRNWTGPHHSHNVGLNQDVRANGGLFSIPFDAQIRAWFVQKVEDLFGQSPLHEDPGTSNEHYHIRGGN